MITETESEAAAPPELSKNVTVLQAGDKTYYILGTAHVSQRSVEEVGELIAQVKPDTVCVELCETRYQTLTQDNQWRKLDILQVIKQGKALMLMASLALSSFQRKLGDKLGVKPGAELLEGVNQAKLHGCQLVLADRDIQVTLKRTWGNLGFWKKFVVMAGLLESFMGNEEISEEELEKMKERDHLNEMMQEFAASMPGVKTPLIDERDQYLMSMIEEAPGQTIVAVVGAGHVSGMQANFGKPIDRAAINVLPPKSKWPSILGWGLTLAVLGIMAYKAQSVSFFEVFSLWALWTGIPAGLGALVAGGRLLSVLTATIAAPITTLIPVLGAGMVAGTVEGYLNKPTVEDCEHVPEQMVTLKGWYRNPFLRTLLVFMGTNVGASLGHFAAMILLAAK